MGSFAFGHRTFGGIAFGHHGHWPSRLYHSLFGGLCSGDLRSNRSGVVAVSLCPLVHIVVTKVKVLKMISTTVLHDRSWQHEGEDMRQ